MRDRQMVLELFEQQKDILETRVNSGIEQHRKGDAVITVTDENGAPIPGARVTARQVSHAFRYGANLFMLDELETEEKNKKYKEIMASFGNMATLPFYWDATEPEKGNLRYDKDSVRLYRRPPIDRCMEFCEAHGIEPREHALAYEKFFPKWLYDADVDTIKAELERRFKEISSRYADKIPTIEVTNEMDWDEGRTAFYDRPEYVEWCFKLAEKYFPHNQLVINDHTPVCWADKGRPTDKYYAYTESAMLKGARIDAIGLQYHMFYPADMEYECTRPFYSPKNLYKHMDMYAGLGKPLQVTEVTIPAYSNDPKDEEIQAELIKRLYAIWFSHPAVEQIIYWNMVDGYAHLWDPSPEKIAASQGDMTLGENIYYGGLLRFDLSAKPAYYAIKNLFEKEWHTETEITTDAAGVCGFRGFYGDYDLDITVDGHTVTQRITLKKNADNTFTLTY